MTVSEDRVFGKAIRSTSIREGTALAMGSVTSEQAEETPKPFGLSPHIRVQSQEQDTKSAQLPELSLALEINI